MKSKRHGLKNGLWLLRYAGRPTPQMIKRWSRKTATNVKNLPHKLKGKAERERENPRVDPSDPKSDALPTEPTSLNST